MTMKKLLCCLFALVLISLCGCSLIPGVVLNNDIETLKGWSFQYNSGTNDYSLFFGLLNSNDTYISADVDVDIRIVNDSNEEVYKATASVTRKDFDYYESKAAGKQYLAEIRIPEKDISTGKSSNGTVYLTVYKDDIVRFDEVNCSALYCLPVADVQLTASDIPKQISIKGYDGSVESVIKITDVQYSYDKSVIPILNIVISGEKVSGSNSNYDMISYKLYDNSGHLVDSGNIHLRSLSKGDKFKDDSVSFYDAVPGETYNIVFSEYSW